MEKYTLERDGQFDFYNAFLPRVNPNLQIEDLLADDNDGVLNGNLLEFKLHVKDLNTVLFQCIKYLSALRIKGKPVPANILIIDLNATTAWKYTANDYLDHIEKVYFGGASKGNSGFIGYDADSTYHYDDPLEAEKMIEVLKQKKYCKIHIDENDIVGWATSFYDLVPTARKEDFIGDETGKHKTIGEIRNPSYFEDYIYPYEGQDNVRFQYLMDKLNDFLQKKNLGAFYTPTPYVKKAHELLREAIKRVPEENDYIILDRCAGTGNLEQGLTDEELSHCILSTIEYYEYKVLLELLGSKVRHIIPPFETKSTFNAGLVNGADALSEEYIKNPVIKQYLDNPECTVILFENPPYSDSTSIEHQKRKAGKGVSWKSSFAINEMKKEIKGSALNDLGNIFIWTAFNYYLRQPTDSYIVFSLIKYWKAQHLIDKKFMGGFAFNRRHFHTKIDACVSCIYWSNEDDEIGGFLLDGYDINKNGALSECISLPIKRVYLQYSTKYYDKREFGDDKEGIIAAFDGKETNRKPQGITPKYNENILGYLTVKGFNFDNPDSCVHLLRVGEYDGHGFYLRENNYLEKLPMFAASRYITYNRGWTERARIMKSADGYKRFEEDKRHILRQYFLKCLLFTCLEMQNHMRTFMGSDGRFYRNELCLDGDTIATRDLKDLNKGEKEEALLNQWNTIMEWAKKTDNYDSNITYGVYQIYDELDTSHKDEDGKTVWDNVELHSALVGLKGLVKDYYNSEIVSTLYKYEFIK